MKTVLSLGTLAFLAMARSFGCGGSFDEAPPTLDYYLDRLPGKSLGEIFVETATPPAPTTSARVPEAIHDITARVKTGPSGKLIAEVDALMAQVRATGGDHEDLARLHDLRDGLVTSPAACAEYMTWRMDRTNLIKPEIKRERWEYPPKSPAPAPAELTAEIEKRAAAISDPMRAHWLYLRGAVSFNHLDKVDAQKWFDKVVQEFPEDPRAEIALFMSGRCLLAQSRASADYSLPQKERERIEAEAKAKASEARVRFRQYLEKYPEGRFVADAYGWLGALDEGVASLDDYIRQVETPGHPEVLKSGVMMIQKRLEDFDFNTPEGEAAIALVAQHPKVAMGLLYQVLGAQAEDLRDDAQKSDAPPVVRMKKWRNVILPRLAAAVAAQNNLYVPERIWQPRYLAILAHAASSAGDQQSAIDLTNLSPKELGGSDDLLFARAISFQRADKTSEALAAFQDLLSRFPSSPLAKGARIRFAIALRDNHESGRAVVELKRLLSEPLDGTASRYSDSAYPPGDDELHFTDSPLRPDITNAEKEQVQQVIDTMLMFAPLPELAAALNDKTDDATFAGELKAIIASRALAQEDFAMAKKFMTPEEFATNAANLEALTARAKGAKTPTSKAKIEAQLGDSWAALRGELLPLKGLPAAFGDEPELAEINRRINGKALGYAQVEKTLDEQDELRHASRWWLRAARHVPATSLSASCRLKVLESIAKVAARSDYAFQRAIEDDSAKVSREIYDKLLAESPGSKEARQAAYWTFPLPAASTEHPGRLRFSSGVSAGNSWAARNRRKSGYYWGGYHLRGEITNEYNEDESNPRKWDDIRKRVFALRDSTKTVPELAEEIAELRNSALILFQSVTEAACLNFLEDLVLILGEPQITDEIARNYINLRLDVLHSSSWLYSPVVPEVAGPSDDASIRARIATAMSDPGMSSVMDYLAFLDAAVVANSLVEVRLTKNKDEIIIPLRDYPTLEKMMRDFLARYPESRKRDAARLLLARAVYRQSWSHFPTFVTDSGEVRIEEFRQEPLNPKRVFAELDAYDREFPDGRYSPQIRDMRASVCWRSADWNTALDLTARQLDDRVPDLQRDGALRLSNIFAELANPGHRPALMDAIRKNPSAQAWLKAYLITAPNYRDHPLRFLGGYLQNQLGFTLPDPKARGAR